MVHMKLCQVPLWALISKKISHFQCCFQFRYPNIQIQSDRSLLTNAYRCDEKWDNRLEDSFIKHVKPSEFYYDLIRKFKIEKKISAVDADIFINSVDKNKSDDLSDELQEIIRLLRRSPETIHTLPSTSHAYIRLLLDTQKYDILFKILTDPLNYGVFLDYYISNLLMNTFLKEENFAAAARIASCSMLQEDFGPPLTRALVLLSCFKYAFSDDNEPWTDYHPVFEPEEEVKVIVKYIRNPYFDDHFDLKEAHPIVGKTLAWLSFNLEDEVLKSHAEIFGWSLYENWNQLEASLMALRQRKQELDEVVVTRVNNQISNCKDSAMNTKLSSLLTDIAKDKLVSNLNIVEKIEENFKTCVSKYEKEFIESQETIYNDWIVKRKEAVDKQMEMIERERLIKEIAAKKKDLEDREDVIFYFENKNKFDLLKPKRKKYYPNKFAIKHRKKAKQVDVEYIPPEV